MTDCFACAMRADDRPSSATRDGLHALQGALEAWDANVRRAAIDALRRMPDPTSVVPLSKILEREDEDVIESRGRVGSARHDE